MSGLTMFQLYLILVLSFFVGMIAVSDHPEWFDGQSHASVVDYSQSSHAGNYSNGWSR